MLYDIDLNTLPVVRDLYRIERKTVWQSADHNHIIVIIFEGTCRFTIDTVDYTVEAGDLFFIPQGQDYVRRPASDRPCTFCYIHFNTKTPVRSCDRETVRQELLHLKSKTDQELVQDSYRPGNYLSHLYLPHKTSLGDLTQEVRELTDQALLESLKNDLESQMIISLCVSHILALASRITLKHLVADSQSYVGERVPVALKKALLFIRQNYTRKLTLDDLCQASNISRQHLIRLFRTALQTTPVAYINKLKVNHAKELMRMTPLSIKEIAYELGFANPHYFSRLFHKVEGVYPTEFLARLKQFAGEKQAAPFTGQSSGAVSPYQAGHTGLSDS